MRAIFGLFAVTILIGFGIQAATSKVSASQAPAQQLQVNKAQLDKCKVLLDGFAKKTGSLKSYDVHGEYGTVEVRERFYAVPFDGKQTLNSVMRCVMTDGRQDDSVDYISYVDYRSHKEVAKWSIYTGLTVE